MDRAGDRPVAHGLVDVQDRRVRPVVPGPDVGHSESHCLHQRFAFERARDASPADAPRGMSFLYSRSRLNVATSRARCATILVCSPELLTVEARSPEQMRLANALCQFVELAHELSL